MQKILITDQSQVYFYDPVTKIATKMEPLETDQDITVQKPLFDFTVVGLPQEIHDLIQYRLVYFSIKDRNFDSALYYILENKSGWVRRKIYSELICAEEGAIHHTKELQENRIISIFGLLTGIFDQYVSEKRNEAVSNYVIKMISNWSHDFCPPWEFVDNTEYYFEFQSVVFLEFEFDEFQIIETGPNFGDTAVLHTRELPDGTYELKKLCRPMILFDLKTPDHDSMVTMSNYKACAKDPNWKLFSLLTKLAFGNDSSIFFRLVMSDCYILVD